jgi:hypothetical protein
MHQNKQLARQIDLEIPNVSSVVQLCVICTTVSRLTVLSLLLITISDNIERAAH